MSLKEEFHRLWFLFIFSLLPFHGNYNTLSFIAPSIFLSYNYFLIFLDTHFIIFLDSFKSPSWGQTAYLTPTLPPPTILDTEIGSSLLTPQSSPHYEWYSLHSPTFQNQISSKVNSTWGISSDYKSPSRQKSMWSPLTKVMMSHIHNCSSQSSLKTNK